LTCIRLLGQGHTSGDVAELSLVPLALGGKREGGSVDLGGRRTRDRGLVSRVPRVQRFLFEAAGDRGEDPLPIARRKVRFAIEPLGRVVEHGRCLVAVLLPVAPDLERLLDGGVVERPADPLTEGLHGVPHRGLLWIAGGRRKVCWWGGRFLGDYGPGCWAC